MSPFRAPDGSVPCLPAGRPYAIGVSIGRSWVHYADGRSWPLWVVTLLLVSALLVVAHRTGFAVGDDPETRHTLGGQHGVYVVVDQFGPDATGKELTREQLQTDVEQLLRTAGIPVLTAAQAVKLPGKPALHVRLMLTRDARHRLYAVYISVEFQQEVALVRDAAVRVNAPTWGVEGIGTVAEDRLHTIREDVGTYIEDFIRDYLIRNSPGTAEPTVPAPHDDRPRLPGDRP